VLARSPAVEPQALEPLGQVAGARLGVSTKGRRASRRRSRWFGFCPVEADLGSVRGRRPSIVGPGGVGGVRYGSGR
jgi:hypothetical protein